MLELVGTFLLVGALAFGGGQAALPLVERLSVGVHGWVTPTQFATAVGLSYATPGPVLIIAAYIGYRAGRGHRAAGPDTAVAGPAGRGRAPGAARRFGAGRAGGAAGPPAAPARWRGAPRRDRRVGSWLTGLDRAGPGSKAWCPPTAGPRRGGVAVAGDGYVGGLAGWVVDVIDGIGAPGVGALIALENVFPPIPSEVILPFAGFAASRGDLDPVLAWAAATVGAVLGAYVLYAVGALIGYGKVHELAGKRWFVLFGQADLARGERFFAKHGSKVVLLGRFVPFVRSVVSVPAGFARMPLWRFTALTAVGSGLWNAVFIYAGFRLGARWEQVQQYLQPVGYAVTAALLTGLVLLVVREARQRPTA